MNTGIKSQLGNLGKGAMKQILQEPVEIVKDVGEQMGVRERTNREQQQQVMESPSSQPQPSLEERKKERIIAAHTRELEDEIARQRHTREQDIEQERLVQEQAKAEEIKRQQEEKKNILPVVPKVKKMFGLVTGRFRKKTEAPIQRAA